jgi:hypothetical protein
MGPDNIGKADKVPSERVRESKRMNRERRR